FYRVVRVVPGKSRASACRAGQPLPGQLDPVRASQGNQLVVEIVGAVVQHARAHAMPGRAMVAVAVAYPYVAARLVLQHEGEIFGAHGRRDVAHDAIRADDPFHDARAEFGFGGRVDGGGVLALEIERGLAIERGGGLFAHRLHARLDEVERGVGKRAYRAADFRIGGNDVVGGT